MARASAISSNQASGCARRGHSTECAFRLRSQIAGTVKLAKAHLGVDKVRLERNGGLVSRHRHLLLTKPVENLSEIKVRSRHSAVEADDVGEGLRGLLRSVDRHKRATQIELDLRGLRVEFRGSL